MFTGLVEAVGTVVEVVAIPSGRRLSINLASIHDDVAIGDSIAINGCCLTVVALTSDHADFEAGPETLERTNLGSLERGSHVNLERALAVGDRLGGHLVQGHIDGVARLQSRAVDGDWEIVWFASPDLATSLVPKGSIAVDGVSLTLCEVTSSAWSVMLIPHTLSATTLGRMTVGSIVNIETDIIGKYVQISVSNILAHRQGYPMGSPA